jgi:hypothetical protein
MPLSESAALVYVLHTGVLGRLTTGSISRDYDAGLSVYDSRGARVDYISGFKLRSWCVVMPDGSGVAPWCSVAPEDEARIAGMRAHGS